MKVRVGIDVGGTFTDVVVIHNETNEIVGQLKIPTTHSAREGVALGIVRALEEALHKFSLEPGQIGFIAHSTTQATNALLEGDVAKVGIVGMGGGLDALLARRATAVPPVPLTAAKSLNAKHRFVRFGRGDDDSLLQGAVRQLKGEGVDVVVASEAFGVDKNGGEKRVVEIARESGMLGTAGHEVSSLYGLRVRTRTAVINAAILPKMIDTATMTDRCVRSAGIHAPLMIMRSDGGVMSVDEVHRRPILTMLSGPAAGIAGALMHERVSDGIFLEVGGTSTDISVIRDGSPAMRPARLSGHRMYLNTLDVRTLGVAGGSMLRVEHAEGKPARIMDVGPRSAHIAGLGYSCFADPAEIRDGSIRFIRPSADDVADHAVLETQQGRRFALTTTCAANLLGLVRRENFAFGNAESARLAFGRLAQVLSGGSQTPEELAERMLMLAGRKISRVIEELIVEYNLDRLHAVLVGGGGGAASIVPYLARMLHLDFRIARNAEVISPLGVAMAMIRDVVERNIVDPKPGDILRVRREAVEAAVASGAAAGTVEVEVEVDKRRSVVRAIAVGATEMKMREPQGAPGGMETCRASAAKSMRLDEGSVRLAAEAGNFLVFSGRSESRSMFGLLRSFQHHVRVVDRTGVVRLQRGNAEIQTCTPAQIEKVLERSVEAQTDYGDAGRAIPDVFVLYGGRIANFSGLADVSQVLALVRVELKSLDSATPMVVLICPK